MLHLDQFKVVWLVDFEFYQPDGDLPRPLCLVARELRSGQLIRLWGNELNSPEPPYSAGPDSLFVAFYASAEFACHLALGWPLPVHVLDLFVEFRNATNGMNLPGGHGLIGALKHFNLPALDTEIKHMMRTQITSGGPYDDAQHAAILDYCQSDVDALTALLAAMAPRIDIGRALVRGRFMKVAAAIERRGIPIDVELYHRLLLHWDDIRDALIDRVTEQYPVFDSRTFKYDLFESWLKQHRIRWPRLPSGRLALDEGTFKMMARTHSIIEPIYNVRVTLSQMKLGKLAVGPDGRNRTMLSAFRSITGRNQPSNTRSVFGPAVWLRHLIQPPPGWGLAYIDFEQQEAGIAAALSGDPNLIAA